MSQNIYVDRSLVINTDASEYLRAQNKRGSAVAKGDVVIWDTTNTTSTNPCFTITTSGDDKLVMGMASEAIANNAYGLILREGFTKWLKVNGTSNIAAGSFLASYTTATIGQLATAGKGGVFGIALEAYTTDDSNGVIDAYLFKAPRVDGTASSLDGAYDAGKTITVDSTAVVLAGSAATTDVLQITNATGSGALLDLAQSGTGADIEGTGDTWTVSLAGLGTFTGIALSTMTAPAATVAYICNTSTGNIVINALTGKSVFLDVAGTPVLTMTGTATTVAQATTLSLGATITAGGLTVTAGGLTVSASGATITGDSTITGSLTVTGNMTWGSTLTVDELVLDTDGSAPTGNCYVVRDNSGDITVNAITGKEVHLSVNDNDELDVSGTEVDIHGNSLVLDADDDTSITADTDDQIDIEINGADDFQFVANSLNVLAGSDLNIADDEHLQLGTTDDGVLLNRSATLTANTALAGVFIGTPVNYALAANSTIISNITQDSDIQIAVNKGGHSQTVLWADGSTGNTYVNAASTGSVYVAVANATEYTFDATNLTVAAANNIKFGGNTGLIDSNGNEVVFVEAVGSATTYLNVKNANGANVVLECQGADDLGFTIANNQDEEILILNSAASSVENITITSGAAGAGAKIAAVTSVTDANLLLDTAGAGNIVLMLGGVDALAIHDAGITLAAADNAAGHALYMQTEDGGADVTPDGGNAGGAWEIRTGDGSASASATTAGGAGGALTLVTGAGLTGNTTGNGGVGGAIGITAGAGGNSGAGAGDGGTGGSITLTAGAGGGAGGGTAGAPGAVVIGAGVFKMKVQTIAMGDTAVTTTLNPSVTVGTLITGNILRVDPESVGGTENLLLPPEADCTGVLFIIDNTADAAENIVVQSDAAGAIGTVGQNERGYFTCDGTTWLHSTGVA